jgi:hypothetical protein
MNKKGFTDPSSVFVLELLRQRLPSSYLTSPFACENIITVM